MRRLGEERWVPDAPTRRAFRKSSIRLDSPASTADLLRRPEVGAESLMEMSPILASLDAPDRRVATETIRYSGYVERQRREVRRVAGANGRAIPPDFVYDGLSGLSHELVEKLERVRPETLGRASRIDGMTPAALALLAVHLERRGGPAAP